MMRYLSVCSGIEAATVAWHPLGWTPAGFCEIEAFPSAVCAHHWPSVPNYGDFTRLIDAAHPIHAAGVDLLVGGTPCQAFSVAGLRQGLADARGGLTLEFVRLAASLRPRWIVWENVPGVLSQDGGRAFGAFLGALGELGYGWAYRVLDAQYFGVAQRRRRVFVVAHSGGRAERAAAVLFEPEGVRRDHPPSREAGQRAAAAAGTGTQGSSGGLGAGSDGGRGIAVAHVDVLPTMVSGGSTEGSHNQLSGQLREQYIVPHVVAPPLTATQADVAGPLDSHYYKGPGSRQGGEREYVAHALPVWRAGDQANSETLVNMAGTLNCNRGQQGGVLFAPATHPEVAEVCGTISDGAHNGGGLNGQDAYTGHILPVAFDTTQITSALNRSSPKAGDPCHPLAAGAHPPAVAFDARQSDVCVYGERTGPLDTDGDTIGVCVTGERTHALRAEGADAGEDGTGRDTPIVPARSVALRGREGGATAELGGEQAGTLRASTGGGDKPHVLTSMAVRRLTPVECERLQGFPDGHTAIPYRGKPAADGPRYKALGNSMAVPVMRWIGERIAKVEKA